MANLPHVFSFEDLEVYKKSRALQRIIYRHSTEFPREEMYALTDQVRRSSRSIGGQISEAWAKRRYIKHFESKITDAMGELNETLHWVNSAFDCEYITQDDERLLREHISYIGGMLNSMLNKSHLFCGSDHQLIREEEAEYQID
jgi:four helix bundle protein